MTCYLTSKYSPKNAIYQSFVHITECKSGKHTKQVIYRNRHIFQAEIQICCGRVFAGQRKEKKAQHVANIFGVGGEGNLIDFTSRISRKGNGEQKILLKKAQQVANILEGGI